LPHAVVQDLLAADYASTFPIFLAQEQPFADEF
jgi:hypothetical protein